MSIIQHFQHGAQDLAYSDGHAAFAEAAMYGTRELMSTITLLRFRVGRGWWQDGQVEQELLALAHYHGWDLEWLRT